MRSELLNKIHDKLETRAEMLERFFPKIRDFDPVAWEKSRLNNTKDNELCNSFRTLSGDDQREIGLALRDIPEEDLIDLQKISEREMEARKGLVQLDTAMELLDKRKDRSERHLNRLQSIREFAMGELGRRQLAKNAEGGVPLDGFTSRFIYGPPPPPGANTLQTGVVWPKKKKFYLARVKSGKIVAVEHIRFYIDDVYHSWVCKELKAAGLKPEDTYTAPCYPTPEQAQVYLKLGFRPDKKITINYQFYWHNNGWNDGWSVSHSREVLAVDVVPVD